MNRIIFIISLLALVQGAIFAQNGTIRGSVFDQNTGEPIILGNVRLEGTNYGTNTDENGFFSLGNLPPKTYKLIATYIGYDSVALNINLKAGAIVYERIKLTESAVELGTVNVSGRREQARADVQISKVTVTPKQIRSLPSTGGESDIAQYLPVLPGIIVSGDQGGQLYIRGGSPVQNKILLDGMTIYNPFHTIGFFSVFETETIRSVDVLTGGFNAEYGGRVSAVVDIKTREGNKKRLSGLVSASPFQAKALIEGPLRPFNEETGSSASFLVTGKHSYLNESSKIFYPYATDTTFFSFASGDTSLADLGDFGLPYQYTDIYGKVSFLGGNGSKFNLFGFNFTDRFNFVGVADLNWTTTGLGTSFTLVPVNSSVVIDGSVSFSNYNIALKEPDGGPRSSSIRSYSAILNFNYFGDKSQINYGFEFNGFNTDLTFRNIFGANIQQQDFTTEVAGYFKYKYKLGNLIIEPGIRAQYYASQSSMSFEPRIGIKYNITDFLRLKAAGGFYSQNLISTVNELDVVNFFVGFLAGPEETIYKPGTRTPTDTRLQKAMHGVFGIEADLANNLELNVEPYFKKFTQLIAINRNKRVESDPDFVTETGDAYGIDFTVRYENKRAYLWLTYSLGYVNRDDGEQIYPTVFDRRHNINALGTYNFGKKNAWEASLRWNMGSGFPFTRTQGFYQDNIFEDLILTDILGGNFDLGTLLSGDRNDGRLSYYHRLDASIKRTFNFSKYTKLEVLASVTNVYNRENVFYVDRISNNRVNQLPILPSLSMTFSF